MQVDRRLTVQRRLQRWVLGVAVLCGGIAAGPAAAQPSDGDAALLTRLAAPAFCDIQPAGDAEGFEHAAALYRDGRFRAAAAQLAVLAGTAQPASGRLHALALWERSLKVLACDAQAFGVQREYQRQAAAQPDAAVERCHALGRLARLSLTRNVDDAERLAGQTLDCTAPLAAADDTASEAHTTLAIVALGRSRVAEAEAQLRPALQRAASPLMRSEALRTQALLVLRRDDDPAAAAQAFDLSLQAARQAGDHEVEAIALIYLGDARLRAGAADGARDFDAGVRLAQADGMRRVLAMARHLHGMRLYRTQTGDALTQAAATLRAGAALYAAIGDRTQESSAWLDLGSVLLEIGDERQARAAVERSRALSIAAGREREAAKADHMLGLFAMSMQPPDLDLARRHLEIALDGLRRGGEDAADEARVLNDLAGAHLAAGRTEAGIAHLLDAARLAQRLRDPALPASIDATLGWAYWRAGLAAPAHTAWRAALRSDQPATRAAAWWGLAQLVPASAPHAALSRYAGAVEEVERLRPRPGTVDDETRTNFGRRYSELYREYAALLLRLGRPAQAHWVATLTQQQELIEAHWRGTRGGDDAAVAGLPGRAGAASCDAALAGRERDALARWSRWQRERSSAREACCRDDADAPVAGAACAADAGLAAYCPLRRAVQSEQRALLRLQDDCVETIEAAARRRERDGGDNAFALPQRFREEWDKAVDGGVHLVVTIVEDDRLHVLLRRPGSDGYMTRTHAVTRAQLQDKADRLAQAVVEAAALKNRPPGPARDAALAAHARQLQGGVLRELYDLLLGSFDAAALAPADTPGAPPVIAFVLDRVLREIPMAALYDGAHYLGERFAVAMVTPTTVAAGATPAPARTALVMGVSKPDLPHVEGEIAEVARLLQAPAYLNEDSTRARLRSWLGDLTSEAPALALHIASHAVMGGSKASSQVRLWGDDALTGNDLEALRRSLRHVRLVVLSACRSAGQGESDLALGLAGLAEKGARSVLGSLWNVDDASTERLMVAFYGAWRRDPQAGVAQALALAQRALLRDFAHPYFWASFEMIGRWN